MGQITDFVTSCRAGTHAGRIARVASGWVILGAKQVVPGYCLLLPDPVVASLNDLQGIERARFLDDMVRVGDALLRVTGARRINYEILGNLEPELHAHVIPRAASEPETLRTRPIWFFDWDTAPAYDEAEHGELRKAIAREIERDT